MKITNEILEDIVKEIGKVINKSFDWLFTGSSAMTGELAEGSDIDIVINQKVSSNMFNAFDVVQPNSCIPARWFESDEVLLDDYGPIYVTINGMKVNVIGIPSAIEFEQWRKATNICILLCKNDKNFMNDKSLRIKIFEILRKNIHDVTIQGSTSVVKKQVTAIEVNFK